MKKENLFGALLVALLIIGIFFILNYSNHENKHEHDYSVEIKGEDMKFLAVQEVADLWEIDSKVFLSRIILEFNLKESYNVDFILEDIRGEYAFSPAQIKDIAEEIKQQDVKNE